MADTRERVKMSPPCKYHERATIFDFSICESPKSPKSPKDFQFFYLRRVYI